MSTLPRYRAGAGASLFSAALAAALASPAHADLGAIRLSAAQSTLKSDGHSTTVITAEVHDDNGGLVPDGTQVRFAVTTGRLDSTIATTQNGVARVVLTSADLPGVCIVTTNLETSGRAAPAQITVIFATDADAAQAGIQWVRVDGKQYVGYAADQGVLQANGKHGMARISYRSLSIAADALQYVPRTGLVIATGNVSVRAGDAKRGETKRTYANLRIDLNSGQGIAERVDEGGKVTALWVDAFPTFEESAPKNTSRPPITYQIFQFTDISESNIVVTAKSVAVHPGKSLQFRGATFYIAGQKSLSLPFHIMPFDQKELFAEQVIGFNAKGPTMDFPLYLDVKPGSIDTLHIRRGARLGSSAYSNQAGFSFDFEQNYNGKQNAEGTLEVNGLTRSDWSARFRHSQRLPLGAEGNFYVDTPNHRDLFGTTSLTRRFKGYSLNLSGSGTFSATRSDPFSGQRIGSGGDLRGQFYAATDPRQFLRSLFNYSLNAGTGRQSYYGFQSVGRGTVDTHYSTLQLSSRQIPLAPRASLGQSFSLGQTWVVTQHRGQGIFPRTGATVLASTAATYQLGAGGTAGLTYDYAQYPLSSSFDGVGRHRIGANLYAQPRRFLTLTANASRGLDVPSDNVSADMTVSLGGPWRTRARYYTSRYAGQFSARFSDVEYALFYRVAGRDLAVYYNTTAHKLQFDLIGQKF